MALIAFMVQTTDHSITLGGLPPLVTTLGDGWRTLDRPPSSYALLQDTSVTLLLQTSFTGAGGDGESTTQAVGVKDKRSLLHRRHERVL